MLGTVVVQAASYFISIERRILRDALARERGRNVLSILEPRVLHAGLGLTWRRAGDTFRRSFGGNAADAPPPGRWPRGPLQIWEGYPSLLKPVPAPEPDGVYRGRGVSILYAVPSALKAKPENNGPVEMTEGVPVTVELVPSGNPEAVDEDLPMRDLRRWVTFPLTRLPVYAGGYTNGKLTIRLADGSGLSAVLRPYDEMHYLRAERFQTQDGRLFSQELTAEWTNLEDRQEGVLEMWFEWTPSKRLLEAWILTAGGESPEGGRPGEWPKEAPWRAEFERLGLAVTRGSWILRGM
jgi:hypothetical protein